LAIPSSSSPVTAETEIAQALGNRPETLWSATGARYVLAPWSALEPLVQAHVLAPVLTFQLNMRTRQVHVAAPAPDACLLAEYTACPPAASVISAWRGALGGQAQVAAMRDATWNPTRDTVTDAADGHATTGQVARICGTARVTARRGSNFCFATTVETDAASDGLLLIDERYAPDLTARLDGQAAAVHRANAWWCAVPVPAGHHLVVIGRQWHPWPSAISAMTGLLVLAWGLLQAHQRLLIPRWADSLRPD